MLLVLATYHGTLPLVSVRAGQSLKISLGLFHVSGGACSAPKWAACHVGLQRWSSDMGHSKTFDSIFREVAFEALQMIRASKIHTAGRLRLLQDQAGTETPGRLRSEELLCLKVCLGNLLCHRILRQRYRPCPGNRHGMFLGI